MGARGLIAVGVPPQPLWLLFIKIAILVLSIVVLALGAYILSQELISPETGEPLDAEAGLDIFVVGVPSQLLAK